MTAQQILDATGSRAANLDRLAAAIDALSECERDSTACAAAMVGLADGSMVTATQAALDCTDVCGAASRVLARTAAPDDRVIRETLEAAIAAAERSASECGKHADHHEHCRVMSQSGRRAVDAGRNALSTYTG
jgi:hypothetical protein